MLVILITLVVALLLILLMYRFGANRFLLLLRQCPRPRRRQRGSSAEASSGRLETGETNSVYAYLQDFAVQDIDLRRAPTGGWHGTYRHDLASGVNHRNTNTSIKQKRSKFWIESGTLSDDEDADEDATTTETGGGGVDDAWAKTRLAQLGSSQKVLASLFADAGTGGNYHGISIEDHDHQHAFGEKAVIHFV